MATAGSQWAPRATARSTAWTTRPRPMTPKVVRNTPASRTWTAGAEAGARGAEGAGVPSTAKADAEYTGGSAVGGDGGVGRAGAGGAGGAATAPWPAKLP